MNMNVAAGGVRGLHITEKVHSTSDPADPSIIEEEGSKQVWVQSIS